jgi:CheY-like chemotaxis protein
MLQNTLNFIQKIAQANSSSQILQLTYAFCQNIGIEGFACWINSQYTTWQCVWESADFLSEISTDKEKTYLFWLCIEAKEIRQIKLIDSYNDPKIATIIPLLLDQSLQGVLVVKNLVPHQEISIGLITALITPHLNKLFLQEKQANKNEIQNTSLQAKDNSHNKNAIISDLKVLVIEDAPSYQIIIKKYLNNIGIINIDIAGTGTAALEFLAKKNYDIILLDNQLPDTEGIAIATIIRKQLEKTLPIIMMTADVTPLIEQKALAAGIDQIIRKPISAIQLYELVEKYTQPRQENAQEPDLTFLRQAADNNESFIKTMLKITITEFEQFVISFTTALQSQNNHDIQLLVHKIKPHIESYKLETLRLCIQEIQLLRHQEQDITDNIEKLQKEIQRICLFFKNV